MLYLHMCKNIMTGPKLSKTTIAKSWPWPCNNVDQLFAKNIIAKSNAFFVRTIYCIILLFLTTSSPGRKSIFGWQHEVRTSVVQKKRESLGLFIWNVLILQSQVFHLFIPTFISTNYWTSKRYKTFFQYYWRYIWNKLKQQRQVKLTRSSCAQMKWDKK